MPAAHCIHSTHCLANMNGSRKVYTQGCVRNCWTSRTVDAKNTTTPVLLLGNSNKDTTTTLIIILLKETKLEINVVCGLRNIASVDGLCAKIAFNCKRILVILHKIHKMDIYSIQGWNKNSDSGSNIFCKPKICIWIQIPNIFSIKYYLYVDSKYSKAK